MNPRILPGKRNFATQASLCQCVFFPKVQLLLKSKMRHFAKKAPVPQNALFCISELHAFFEEYNGV